MTDDTDTEEYRLRDGVEKINSAGVLLEGDDTVELTPDEVGEINGRHGDVLEPVGDSSTGDEDADDGGDA